MSEELKNTGLNPAIENRKSPKSFSSQEIPDHIIGLLFEAARRAPSARNEQPWTYYFAKKSEKKGFEELCTFLNPGNQEWAIHAPLLIVSVARKYYEDQNRPNRNAFHDLGAANVSLAIQAAEMGLQVRQMGGFDKTGVSGYLNLDPERSEPVTMIAVGFPENAGLSSDKKRQMESSVPKRKSINQFVFNIGQNPLNT